MMAEEDYWANVDPADPRSAFAQPITKMRKVVFSKTLDQSKWPNTDLAKGELADEVTRLKAEQGKDIIGYGGPNFAGSLLRAGLIDEFHLFVNPVVLGAGRSMFKARRAEPDPRERDYLRMRCGRPAVFDRPRSDVSTTGRVIVERWRPPPPMEPRPSRRWRPDAQRLARRKRFGRLGFISPDHFWAGPDPSTRHNEDPKPPAWPPDLQRVLAAANREN